MSTALPVKLLFVINPGAGPGNSPWKDIIHNYFTGKNFQTEYFFLEKNDNESKLEKYIREINPAKTIAVGGDGTVTMVAKVVSKTSGVLGILPAGSANGMAKELNIPQDVDTALNIVETGIIKDCDAICINKKEICLHLSDLGINAQLVKYFDEGKLRGKWGYARMILKTLWFKQKMQLVIHTDEKKVYRDAFMVVLANASKYGTGAVINPTGELDDGQFEVVIVRKLAFSELVRMIFRPGPFNPKKIEIIPATSVNIHTRHRSHFQIDGEYKGKINNLKAEILPGYVKVILPSPENDL